MLQLNEKGINVLIKKNKNKKIDMFWNNYEFIIWEKNLSGFNNVNGMFRNNSWGISKRIPLAANGMWLLPIKYVRYFK